MSLYNFLLKYIESQIIILLSTCLKFTQLQLFLLILVEIIVNLNLGFVSLRKYNIIAY